jgi:hypothetical protein
VVAAGFFLGSGGETDSPKTARAVSFSRFRGLQLWVDEASSLVFADNETRQDASSTLNDTALPGLFVRRNSACSAPAKPASTASDESFPFPCCRRPRRRRDDD